MAAAPIVLQRNEAVADGVMAAGARFFPVAGLIAAMHVPRLAA